MPLYIRQNYSFRKCHLIFPIFVVQICPLSLSITKTLEGPYLCLKYAPFYMIISVCQQMSLCACLYKGTQKCCSLYAFTINCKDAPHICLYIYLKRCTSVYAYVRVSIYVSLYMPILWFASVPIYKCVCHKCFYVYASIRESKDGHLYMPIYEFSNIPISVCLYLVLN